MIDMNGFDFDKFISRYNDATQSQKEEREKIDFNFAPIQSPVDNSDSFMKGATVINMILLSRIDDKLEKILNIIEKGEQK